MVGSLPAECSLLLELVHRLILLESERNAALAFLLDCRDGQGHSVDWPSRIKIASGEGSLGIRKTIALKYELLEEYLRGSECDCLTALSHLVSIPVDQVSDNPLWRPSGSGGGQ